MNQENMKSIFKKSQSMARNPKMTQMLILVEKYYKIAIISMFNEVQGKIEINFSREIKTIKTCKCKNLELIYVISEILIQINEKLRKQILNQPILCVQATYTTLNKNKYKCI